MGASPDAVDVVVIGGGLFGSMAATMFQRRGLRVATLEARPIDAPHKHAVGEAITEGSSIFLRHEMGLDHWLLANTFRKFGFDFLLRPGSDDDPATMEDCHELLLSLTLLERHPKALARLIPTYHVEREALDREVKQRAIDSGVRFEHQASVTNVEIGDLRHEVHYEQGAQERSLGCRWVIDCTGRRSVLGKQLGIHHREDSLPTAAIWNRFRGVADSPELWRTFSGIDRRRHTIHFGGEGFWFWWIHQNDELTSVGVSYDTRKHRPNVKAEDRGWSEMIAKFPLVGDLLGKAEPLEPFHHLAHLPYRSDHWVDPRGYALIGDAGWFVDAIYSTAIETGARQLMALLPLVETSATQKPCETTIAELNEEFRYLQAAALAHNRFKYEHAWHHPRAFFQVALYELAEIAELYHMERKEDWRPELLERHYRLQWGSKKRLMNLERFMAGARQARPMTREQGLLKKSLSPGPTIYRATWPYWNVRGLTPYFFIITRLWGFVERYAQRFWLFPDLLSFMAARKLPAMKKKPMPLSSPPADVRG